MNAPSLACLKTLTFPAAWALAFVLMLAAGGCGRPDDENLDDKVDRAGDAAEEAVKEAADRADDMPKLNRL